MRRTLVSSLAAVSMALALAVPGTAHAQLVGTGTSGNCFPFGCISGTNPGTVYQQVYASSNFASAGFLQEVSFFRISTGGDLMTGTFDIYFSTTSVAVNGLSTSNFDGNRGADNALFGSFVLSGAAPSVLSFVGSQFFYDPTLGNLLMDIRYSGPGGDPNASAFFRSNNGDAGGVYSRAHDFGTQFADWGLQTEFVFEEGSVVPEPASMTLLATGLAGLAASRRRRKSAQA